MFVGGAFVRSESGRYFQVKSAARSRGRRSRDASTSRAARAKTCATRCSPRRTRGHGWAKRTAYNRGQILYRLAEVMESRRAELTQSLVRGGARRERGRAPRSTRRSIAPSSTPASPTSTTRSLASSNPVAGPHFDFSVPEPMGVVGVVAPERPALLGLVSTVLPVDHRRQHRASRSRARPIRAPRSSGASASRRATCPAASSTSSPATRRSSRRTSRKHREVIGIDAWIVDAELRKTRRARRRRQREAREDARADGPRRAGSTSARRRASAGSSASSRRRRSGTRRA